MAMYQQDGFQHWAAYAGQQHHLQMPMPHPMQPMYAMHDVQRLQSAQPTHQLQIQPTHLAPTNRPGQAMHAAPTMWQPNPAAQGGRFSNPAPPPRAPAHVPLPSAAPASAVGATEVLAAVESLYRDMLRPYGRIVCKRLSELSDAAGDGEVDVDAKRLRSLCEGCVHLTVVNEDGGDWSALIVGRSESFVDVYSPQDLYPPELWQAAAAYFAHLGDDEMALPGGRYSCAQVLMGRGLGFLSGRSLGEVCHIVQLAISQKKLLGYLNGAVVPYQRSQSMVKERCAERQRPCAGAPARGGAAGLATWDMVRTFLEDVLGNMGPNSGFIPLSNIKRLFRSKLRAELSETALGHAKLSELLQDERVSDLCCVRLQGHGYAVFPKAAAPAPARPAAGSAARRAAAAEAAAPALAAVDAAPSARPPAVDAARPAEAGAASQAGEAASQPVPLPTLLHSTAVRREDPTGPPVAKPILSPSRARAALKAAGRLRPCALEATSDDEGPSCDKSTPSVIGEAPCGTPGAEKLTTPCRGASLWTKPLLTPVGKRKHRRSASLPRNLACIA